MNSPLSWGRAHRFESARFERATSPADLAERLRSAWDGKQPVTPYGLGRSYGDSCLSEAGLVLQSHGLDCLVAFDRSTGVVTAEAGLSIDHLLQLTVPAGWFVPVCPGTKFVTLGGAVANDVHGKNHHRAGSFGHHVTGMGLHRSSGERLWITPSGHPDLWAATIGGLGLTGFIDQVELQLTPIRCSKLETGYERFESLDQFVKRSAELGPRYDYLVAWCDCITATRSDLRGILFHAQFSDRDGPLQTHRSGARFSIPWTPRRSLIGKTTTRWFNRLYYRAPRRTRSHYGPFFFPLDGVGDWNRLYGRRGLFQYQCVIPGSDAPQAIGELLHHIGASGQGSFLSVLKVFGPKASAGLLSFPQPGITLALDFPNLGQSTLSLLSVLDQIVLQAGGRIYPAKDGRVSAAAFQAMYPRWEEFSTMVDPGFESAFWNRVSRC